MLIIMDQNSNDNQDHLMDNNVDNQPSDNVNNASNLDSFTPDLGNNLPAEENTNPSLMSNNISQPVTFSPNQSAESPEEANIIPSENNNIDINSADNTTTNNQQYQQPIADIIPPQESTAEVDQNNLVPSSANTNASLGTPLNPAAPVLKKKKSNFKLLLVIVLIILLLVGSLGAGYYLGQNSRLTLNSKKTATKDLMYNTVPQGATVIAQCTPGYGTQYVLPQNIPYGPVYNVYKGKLIGIEYMMSTNNIMSATNSFSNLPLFSHRYVYTDISYMAPHAGFPLPHLEFDIMMKPKSFTNQITCQGASSGGMASPSNMKM